MNNASTNVLGKRIRIENSPHCKRTSKNKLFIKKMCTKTSTCGQLQTIYDKIDGSFSIFNSNVMSDKITYKCINYTWPLLNNFVQLDKNLILKSEGIIKTISYKLRVYESVDDRNLDCI